jgi:hypothetical protein
MNKKVIFVVIFLALATFGFSFLTGRLSLPGSMGQKVMIEDDWSRSGSSYGSDSVLPSMPAVMEEPVYDSGYGDEYGGTKMATDYRGIYPEAYPRYIRHSNALDVNERVYIKSSYHQVVVEDVRTYSAQMKDYILSINGRILDTSINSIDRYKTGYLNVKVPVERFDEAVNQVASGTNKVVSEQVSSEDVTGSIVAQDEEMVRLQEEISLKEVELESATANTAEWRRINTQLQNLMKQLDRIASSSENYQEEVSYSTININFADSERYFTGTYGGHYQPDIRDIAYKAWWSVRDNFSFVLTAAVWIAVYGVFWAPVVLLIMWLKRRKSANKVG